MEFMFQENPNITYTPLMGQSLVSQITTPITVDALANLINSDWPISSVLGLSADRLTPAWLRGLLGSDEYNNRFRPFRCNHNVGNKRTDLTPKNDKRQRVRDKPRVKPCLANNVTTFASSYEGVTLSKPQLKQKSKTCGVGWSGRSAEMLYAQAQLPTYC